LIDELGVAGVHFLLQDGTTIKQIKKAFAGGFPRCYVLLWYGKNIASTNYGENSVAALDWIPPADLGGFPEPAAGMYGLRWL
jgi:hypothetical protein